MMKRSWIWFLSKPLTLAVAAGCVALTTARTASAEESAYCRKVHARASSDSALLYAPAARAEALKLPTAIQPGGRIDPVGAGNSYQFRAGLSISAVNIYKGTRLSHVADADCAHHEAVFAAQELLSLGLEVGRLAALRSQAEYLESRRPDWEDITKKTDERFQAKTTTLLNVVDVRARATTLVRRQLQVQSDVARLEAIGIDKHSASIDRLMNAVDSSAMRYEREASHVRSLDAWDINVTGGYVPPILDATRSDFFGLVQISYNLGGPWRNAAESRYLAAREEELKNAKHELRRQLAVFRDQAKRANAHARRELEVIERSIAVLRADRTAVESSDAPSVFYASSMLDLELIGAESERVYLAALIRELSKVEEEN
jgi:hypothetical protein